MLNYLNTDIINNAKDVHQFGKSLAKKVKRKRGQKFSYGDK